MVGTNIPGTLPVLGEYVAAHIAGRHPAGRPHADPLLRPPRLALAGCACRAARGPSVPDRVPRRERAAKALGAASRPQRHRVVGARRFAISRPRVGTTSAIRRLQEAGVTRSGRTSILEDMIVAVVSIVAILGLLVWQGVPLEARADPANTAYVPRPDWYFLFLFQLLKYFPGNLEWLGAGVLPTVVFALIFLLPLYDRSPWRSPGRRPVAMAIGGFLILATALLTFLALQS